ncbi:hypothetical protein chiPu_0023424, partial [Chiloscyllium punctatum]|nr:hypothetical protein [Chiloscyllium punctatum]
GARDIVGQPEGEYGDQQHILQRPGPGERIDRVGPRSHGGDFRRRGRNWVSPLQRRLQE